MGSLVKSGPTPVTERHKCEEARSFKSQSNLSFVQIRVLPQGLIRLLEDNSVSKGTSENTTSHSWATMTTVVQSMHPKDMNGCSDRLHCLFLSSNDTNLDPPVLRNCTVRH